MSSALAGICFLATMITLPRWLIERHDHRAARGTVANLRDDLRKAQTAQAEAERQLGTALVQAAAADQNAAATRAASIELAKAQGELETLHRNAVELADRWNAQFPDGFETKCAAQLRELVSGAEVSSR